MEEIVRNYKTELEKNGAIAFVPGGNSMWPTLKNRGQSVIVVKKEERLNRYDVAFYQRADGTFVLHRVMEVIEGGYIMLGDSQFTTEKVAEGQVFGVMSGFYRGKKFVDVKDKKYLKEIKNYFKRKKLRAFRLKCFYLKIRIKNKLKRTFSRKQK